MVNVSISTDRNEETKSAQLRLDICVNDPSLVELGEVKLGESDKNPNIQQFQIRLANAQGIRESASLLIKKCIVGEVTIPGLLLKILIN